MNRIRLAATTAVCASLLLGCETEDTVDDGELALVVSGGLALDQGFPHVAGDVTREFVDGWEIQFSTYAIALANVRLVDPGDGAVAAEWEGPAILDMRRDGGFKQPLTTLTARARRLDIEMDVVPATELAENRNVDPDAAARMVENGWSWLIEGEATRDDEVVGFSFGLEVHEHYFECLNGEDGTQGIVVENRKTTGAIIHPCPLHLFSDTLSTGDEDFRFEAFAAVAGEDGIVTIDELATQNLTDLRAATGERLLNEDGSTVRYNDDGKLTDTPNLAAFVHEGMRECLHFNGPGFCNSEPIE
jgi:hypothetical protein